MSHEKEISITVEVSKSNQKKLIFHHDHVEGRKIKEVAGVPLHEDIFRFHDGKYILIANDEVITIKQNEFFVIIPKGAIRYSVNDEPQWTSHKELTPVQIMKDAGIDPDKNYLTEIKADHHRESYKDQPNTPIHMHDGMKFITTFVGPKPVSNG